MEFEFHGLVRLKVRCRWRLCLKYSCTDKYGELYEGGLITLDKRWMMPCATAALLSTWYRLHYDPKKSGYFFPDPTGDDKDYSVYQQLIDAVDNVLIEQGILGLNPETKNEHNKERR